MAGESRVFHFVSTWVAPAPAEAVWRVLAEVEAWPDWWSGIESVRSSAPSTDAEPQAAQVVVRSPLGYRLRFTLELTRSEPPRRSTFGVRGQLRGSGFWAADPADSAAASDATDGAPVTRMRIGWCVVSDRRLVRLLAPLARWAHGRIMAAGSAGLARRLREQPPAGLSR
ncbi:SRPBCC family protein [Pseudactinotalea sp. HY158]|uniref:SRPBCC family protein n=1 Tax=Pseudactinotalea sp. HY158 TaxID=2654547 RepID=UPI00129C4FEA|nr:SRPBCC family protein [Pseudactinotalea sp. HY158]QGH69421.1 hypothetical protein GCE65_07735 [Pseudactinotalea sp. HY158]